MWTSIFYMVAIASFASSEVIGPGIHRTVNEGVTSQGFNVIYTDDEMTMFNHVGTDGENNVKSKTNAKEVLPQLPAEDVKCLMSVDRYCSAEMGKIKSVLILALKEDCKTCTAKQKEEAGKVAASMMAHDPTAWKMFLTRYEEQQRVQRIIG